MPELPEVETSRRGISPHIVGKTLQALIVRQAKLRWPVPENLNQLISGKSLKTISRRGKYLLLDFGNGFLIIHLGMSGSLRITTQDIHPNKHDHIDWIFADGTVLRFNDPRKFGAVLWTTQPEQHVLLSKLGPEPLSDDLNAAYLLKAASQRRIPIKTFIMNSHVVVGVGNIYASESLFWAGIHPTRGAGEVSLDEFEKLVLSIQKVLSRSIEQGGTTLRDYVNPEGKPGYFQQTLQVYGRRHEACRKCSTPIEHIKIAQRASYYCPGCQS